MLPIINTVVLTALLEPVLAEDQRLQFWCQQIRSGATQSAVSIPIQEFQRTHTLCALSMYFQSTACMCSNNYTAVAGVLHCTRQLSS